MSESSDKSIVKSRLYSLREVEESFHLRPDAIIRYASESQTSLCVLVPPGKRVYHIGLVDLNWDLTDFDVEKIYRHYAPLTIDPSEPFDPWTWPQIAGASTLALVVDSRTCEHVMLFGRQRRRFFRGALQFYEGPVIGFGQVLAIRPMQEFVDLPDGMGPEESYDYCRLGIYSDNVRFSDIPGTGIIAPEEMEISPATLYIVGEQLEIFLSGTCPTSGPRLGAMPERVITKSYPPPLSNMTVPKFASSRLKALADIAKSHWSGVRPGRPQAEYDAINERLVDELRKARKNIPLAEDQLEIAAGIVRPLWAQRGLSPEIKESRLKTFVTPDFEKILLVAHRVSEWKKSLASSSGSKPKYGREHPSDKEVIAWLADSEHFSVSSTHKAPVAAKLLRSVSGARTVRAPKQSKSGKKKKI